MTAALWTQEVVWLKHGGTQWQSDPISAITLPLHLLRASRALLGWRLLALDPCFFLQILCESVAPSDSFSCADRGVGLCLLLWPWSTQWIRLLMLLTAGRVGQRSSSVPCCPRAWWDRWTWALKVRLAFFWFTLLKASSRDCFPWIKLSCGVVYIFLTGLSTPFFNLKKKESVQLFTWVKMI